MDDLQEPRMRVKTPALKALSLLTLSVAVVGCARVEQRFADATGSLSAAHVRFVPSLGGQRLAPPAESLTVMRVRGGAETPEALRTEPGDVWPREEGPRATLANPEEALRGVRTGEAEPRRTRGSSGSEGAPNAAPPVLSPIFEAPTPPPRANRTDGVRESGQVFQSQQGPVVSTTGAGRVQTTISPQGSGLAIRDGATTTLIGPGGTVQQVPTPR
jgi:hypothetical protein